MGYSLLTPYTWAFIYSLGFLPHDGHTSYINIMAGCQQQVFQRQEVKAAGLIRPGSWNWHNVTSAIFSWSKQSEGPWRSKGMEKLTSLDGEVARSRCGGASGRKGEVLWLQIQSTTWGSGIMFINFLMMCTQCMMTHGTINSIIVNSERRAISVEIHTEFLIGEM